MPNSINDAEIHEIVQRVLHQVLGNSTRESASSSVLSSAKTEASGRKVVAIGADHGGFELKEVLKKELTTLGFEVNDVGTNSKDAVDYPDFAHAVAQLVGTGKAWRGIMIDGAGIGSCIVANKVPGVRAGMAYDYSSAVKSREHNDTNVLTLGAGLIGVNLAKQIVKTWLTTEFAGGRHTPRIDKIKSVEKKYLK
jgi:ribose 5-phosphate isomerase B